MKDLDGSDNEIAEHVINPNEEELPEEESVWYFTFGVGHKLISYEEGSHRLNENQIGIPLAGNYVKVIATSYDQARSAMMAKFGREWAFQYSDDTFQKMIRESRHTYTKLMTLRA